MPSAAAKELTIVLLGTGGVGKSALSCQYVQSVFIEQYDPTIEDSYRKVVDVPSAWLGTNNTTGTSPIILEIMDTAGTDQFTAMRDLYMKSGDAFLLVYSIDCVASLEYLGILYEQLLKVRGAEAGQVPVLLVGNKCDLDGERQVSRQQVCDIAERWKLTKPFETSARKDYNVKEAFMQVIQLSLRSKIGGNNSSITQSTSSKRRERGGKKCILM